MAAVYKVSSSFQISLGTGFQISSGTTKKLAYES